MKTLGSVLGWILSLILAIVFLIALHAAAGATVALAGFAFLVVIDFIGPDASRILIIGCIGAFLGMVYNEIQRTK